MKYFASFFIFLFVLVSCQKELEIQPETYLNAEQQELFKYSVIRYVGRLPKKVTHETKFNTAYDSVYGSMAQKTDLMYYYEDTKSGAIFFAMARIAPSVKLKKVATVGQLTRNESGEIISYEEAFRTWKMEEPELKEKTAMLFEKYIRGEDLSPFYTLNSGEEFYIEFPDENTHYDKEQRRWVSSTALPFQQ